MFILFHLFLIWLSNLCLLVKLLITTIMSFLILIFVMFRINTRVVWLVLALVIMTQCFWELDWLCLPSIVSVGLTTSTLAMSISYFVWWHHHLGHICGSRLSDLISHGLLGLVLGHESPLKCQGCWLGKHIQLSYHSSEFVSQRRFDLVHLDIWAMLLLALKGPSILYHFYRWFFLSHLDLFYETSEWYFIHL